MTANFSAPSCASSSVSCSGNGNCTLWSASNSAPGHGLDVLGEVASQESYIEALTKHILIMIVYKERQDDYPQFSTETAVSVESPATRPNIAPISQNLVSIRDHKESIRIPQGIHEEVIKSL